MSKEQFDYVVYIGRLAPFHDGQFQTLKTALNVARTVIIVLGSCNAAPTPKNPWTAEVRKYMIREAAQANGIDLSRIQFIEAEDRLYSNNKWIQFVQINVDRIAQGAKVGIIGYEKDESSWYINQFPWEFVDTGPYIKEDGGKVVSATKIRELLFENHLGYAASNLPPTTYAYLQDYITTPKFTAMQAEYDHYIADETRIEHLEHGQLFGTADSLVTQSGHILLVKRGTYPGKGLWALPGVHLGHNETFQEASIRALVDETHLKVGEKVLYGSLKDFHMFDHPNRSLRGRLTKKNARTVTMAYFYQLDSSHPLPKSVRGGTGIEKAWWFTLSEVYKMRSEMFEDHADIIDYFIK